MSEVEVQTVPAEMLREVRLDEQKRIIKLLEEHMPNSSDHDFVGCECEYPTNNWYNNHIIALIKGEN